MRHNEVTGIQIKSSKNVGTKSETYEVKYIVTYADGLEIDSSVWYVNCTDEMDAVAAVYKRENYHGV